MARAISNWKPTIDLEAGRLPSAVDHDLPSWAEHRNVKVFGFPQRFGLEYARNRDGVPAGGRERASRRSDVNESRYQPDRRSRFSPTRRLHRGAHEAARRA